MLQKNPHFKTAPKQDSVALPDGKSPVALGSGTVASILGLGGAAVVYEIDCPRLSVRRAVKVLKPNLPRAVRERFDEEIRVAAQFHHPNIVTIHTVGEWNGLPYIEMEKIDGLTLDLFVQRHFPLPPEVSMAIGADICRALESMHTCTYEIKGKTHRGIQHRDLKPANILISTSGEVKLTDFGIASPPSVGGHPDRFEGSLQYSAPELFRSSAGDIRSDIYSLGVVLYETVTGLKAFPQTEQKALVRARFSNSYETLNKLHLKIPHGLESLITRCMAEDPEKRPQSARDVREELEALLARTTGEPPQRVLPSYVRGRLRPKSIRAKVLAWSAAALVVLGTGSLVGRLLVDETDEAAGTHPSTRVEFEDSDQEPATRQPPPEPPPVSPKEPAGSPEKPEAGPAPPAPVAAPPPPPEPTLVDSLRMRYGTTDIAAIFEREVLAGKFQSAAKLVDSLPVMFATSNKGILYRMRTFQALNNTDSLAALFENMSADDGQFLYEKARHFYGRGRYRRALHVVEQVPTVPTLMETSSHIRREAKVLKARILTNIYHTDKQEDSRKQALDAWFEVKFSLRSNRDDPDFAYANEQIRLLSDEGT